MDTMDAAALENEKKLLRRLTISSYGFLRCIEILSELAEQKDINHTYEAALSYVVVAYARPFSGNEKNDTGKALSKLSKDMVEVELEDNELKLHKLIIKLRNKAIAHAEWKTHPAEIDENYVIMSRPFSVFVALQGYNISDIFALVTKVRSVVELEKAKSISMLKLLG